MHGLAIQPRSTFGWISAALSLAIVAGCGRGDGLNRVVVAGAVTLDGEPAQVGQIRFIPQGDTAGPVTISPIAGGRYRSDQFGGVPAGDHRVEILIWDPKVPPPRGPGGPPRPQWAPKKYNRDSELKLTVNRTDPQLVADWQLTRDVR
jgi:hypothetical protein